jgi:GTP cyclohydrolase I
MAAALRDFLRAAGLDAAADGEAPGRTADAWCEHLLAGYGVDPGEVLEPVWADRGGQLITLTQIPFVSMCAHHLLPFFGRAHVAYLPDGRLTGLSKIEELVRGLSRRLQVQERLGVEIADALQEGVGARGAACILEAEHLCVFGRGSARGTLTRTFAFTGELASNAGLQDRCMSWLLADGRDADPATAVEGDDDE